MGKYFKYAIGEILLVVIGILIALQINNWNERRKASSAGVQYLLEIRSDLEKDVILVDDILTRHSQSISVISSVDSIFHKNPVYEAQAFSDLFIKPDTIDIEGIFYRDLSFRSINGTYKSLIADGKSGLIKNRILFQEIQQIYDEFHERVASVYTGLKEIESKIIWAYPKEKQLWTYSDLKQAKDEKVFAHLASFTEQKYFYAQNLADLKKKTQKVIELIDKELE